MAKVIFDFDPDQAGSLHCDACGYDAPDRIALTPSHIGTACPKCGADMLTASDYEKTVEMVKAIQAFNALFGSAIGHEPAEGDGTHLQIKIHDDTMTMQTGGDFDAD